MEDIQREHIKKNVNELIENTKYTELITVCESIKLISKVMRSRIDNMCEADESAKHRELFIKITRRGPTAYNTLLQVLINLQYTKAASILHSLKTKDSQYISMHNPSTINSYPAISNLRHTPPEGCYPSKDKVDSKMTLTPYTKEIHLKNPLEVIPSKCIQTDSKLPIYPMKSRNRGVFFMVDIIEFKSKNDPRNGAELDEDHLLYLFREFGFTCFAYRNLTREQFFTVFEELRNSEYLARTECFVMALMSHGEMLSEDMHDRVEFHDGSIVKVIEIEDLLSNEQCPYLLNKPKVLIFPFCRGIVLDKGVNPNTSTITTSATANNLEVDGIPYGLKSRHINVPSRSDMIVCYASVRGFETVRDPEKGSWYIQTFCRVLAKHAHDTHFDDMLKLIANKVKNLRTIDGYLQMPAHSNHGFTKLLFFNPGVYED